MRFISKYAAYTINFQTEYVQYVPDGQGNTHANVTRPLLNCEFRNRSHVTIYPWELDVAKTFQHRGGLVEGDEMTPFADDIALRISVFDTVEFASQHGLDDDTRKRLENHLLTNSAHGSDYVMVTEPRIPAPWPSYDDVRGARDGTTAEKIAAQVVALGFDRSPAELEKVLAYERQNANRTDVLLALQALMRDEELVEPEMLISA